MLLVRQMSMTSTLAGTHAIRPSLIENAGAVTAIKSFTADLLVAGQSPAFLDLVMELVVEADAARRD
jgi:hypothetical protein